MMARFLVEVTETVSYTLLIEAEDAEAAENIAVTNVTLKPEIATPDEVQQVNFSHEDCVVDNVRLA